MGMPWVMDRESFRKYAMGEYVDKNLSATSDAVKAVGDSAALNYDTLIKQIKIALQYRGIEVDFIESEVATLRLKDAQQ